MSALPANPTTRSYPPTAVSRDLDRLVGRLTNGIEQTPSGALEVSSKCAPTEAERRVVQLRIRELTACLRRDESPDSADEAEVTGRIARLLGGMPTMGASGTGIAMKVDLCVEALRPFPVWVVDRACALVRDGRADALEPSIRKGYAPEAPQLADLCRRIIAPVQHERAELHRLLSAKVYEEPTEADMARRDEVIAKAMASFNGGANDLKRAATPHERRAAEHAFRKAEAKEAGEPHPVSLEGVAFSEELRTKLASEA